MGVSDNVVTQENLFTRYVSTRIAGAPGVDGSSQADLLGKNFGEIFDGDECVATVRSLMERVKLLNRAQQTREPRTVYMSPNVNSGTSDFVVAPNPTSAEILVALGEEREVVTFTLTGSRSGLYILDVEPTRESHARAGAKDTPSLLKVTDLSGRIPVGADPATPTAALCDALAQTMPAYDRVMVYRFNEDDGSGEVIHERVRPGADIDSSYLGLRFPAADIPPKAREMFKMLGARFIADTSAPAVPLKVLHKRVESLDLSKSPLRAAADCHLRYLRNMGVRASLVVAIVVDGRLWGLYIFHSYTTTVHPTCKERIMAEMAATITGSMISRLNREEVATTALSLSRVLGRLLSSYTGVNEFLSAEHKPLLEILDAETLVLCEHSRTVTVYGNRGVSLTLGECKELGGGDRVQQDRELKFRSLQGRGVAFFSVRSSFIAFVRGSVARSVSWAGKPDDPKDGRELLHPRASFEKFMEVAAAKFQAWSPATVELLNTVRQTFASQLYAEGLPADLQETFAQVSHELRTPFHGVMGALEMLEAGQGSMGAEEQLDIIRSARRCGDSMMSTLDDILNIAKDRNNTEVAQARFIASSPISLAMAAMGPFASTESVGLVADTGPADSVLDVLGDCGRIKGVVQNLVNNAIKFTPNGGTVRTSLAVFDSLQDVTDWWDKEAVRFEARVWIGRPSIDGVIGGGLRRKAKWHVYCVEDSGIGISPGDLPHTATAYRQVSKGASKLYAGTGLGLHICKGHVDAMFGALGIASTFSEEAQRGGSLFAVVLPLVLAEPTVVVEEGEVKNPTMDVLSENPWRGSIGSRRAVFLVVDDHKVNLKLIEHKIKRHMKSSGGDAEVLCAMSALSALDMYEATRSVRLEDAFLAGVFIDIHMPDIDGIECTRRIRLLEVERGWSRMIMCGCTADLTAKTQDNFKDAGGDDITTKPWHPGQLEAMCDIMVATQLDAEEKNPGGTGGASEEDKI